MSKIPVFNTVGETYDYSFRNYLNLFAVTWLPLLVATVASYFIIENIMPQTIAMMKEQMAAAVPGAPPANPLAAMPMMGWMWALDFAMLFVFVMMAVGITKEVLGVREAPRFFYLRFGADEFRLLGGLLIVVLVVIVAIVGLAIVGGIVAGIAMAGAVRQNAGAMAGVMILIMFVLYLIGFYFMARLTFFQAPVVVEEKKMGIGRSWQLSSGNFWRIFTVGLFIWIPLAIVEGILFAIIMGPALASAFANIQPGNPQGFVTALLEVEMAKMPYLLALSFVLSPFLYGLIFTPSVFAYKAVTAGEKTI